MTIVADRYAYVIGVHTHARTHTYAIINTTTGARQGCAAFPVTDAGMKRAFAWIGRNTTVMEADTLAAAWARHANGDSPT